ncbi:hypothetical protein CRG98_032349 [Punica granatum]|uniref:Uncharacterized protein n=1 Tax=Punica granatum TaxID=22663 RepID=A0A2I0IU29_PUNGR|nr:hypothetical protein CRG98_032349 [Punica granatum]
MYFGRSCVSNWTRLNQRSPLICNEAGWTGRTELEWAEAESLVCPARQMLLQAHQWAAAEERAQRQFRAEQLTGDLC